MVIDFPYRAGSSNSSPGEDIGQGVADDFARAELSLGGRFIPASKAVGPVLSSLEHRMAWSCRFSGLAACQLAYVEATNRTHMGQLMLNRLPDHEKLYEHILRRDPELDGVVLCRCEARRGIFCRPVCPARTPLSKNVAFYGSPDEALAAGFRPCKRCRPLDDPDAPGVLIDQLLRLVEQDPSRRWSEDDLEDGHRTRATARAAISAPVRHAFRAVCARARRLGRCFQRHQGRHRPRIEAQLDAGFDSGSGFREAFSKTFGEAPNKARAAEAFAMDWIDSAPLGPMFAVADDTHLHMLEFVERKKLEEHVNRRYRQRLSATVLPGETKAMKLIRKEMADYFAAGGWDRPRRSPAPGTDFQNQVWDELRKVPPGVTRSYQGDGRAHRTPGTGCARGGERRTGSMACAVSTCPVIA